MRIFSVCLMLVALFAFGSSAIAGEGCPSSKAKLTKANSDGHTGACVPGKDCEVVIFTVSNMTCGGCVGRITKTLTAVEGVHGVKVSLEKGTATVHYKIDSKVEPSMLTAVVTKAGYPAKLSDAKATGAKAAHGGCDPAKCKDKKACCPGKK
ncbi:MAG: heavy metal-associated domain-containing protein [candidate division Zixibacteria bacterium]